MKRPGALAATVSCLGILLVILAAAMVFVPLALALAGGVLLAAGLGVDWERLT